MGELLQVDAIWTVVLERAEWLLRRWFDQPLGYLIIDNTMVFRASRQAPGAGVHLFVRQGIYLPDLEGGERLGTEGVE